MRFILIAAIFACFFLQCTENKSQNDNIIAVDNQQYSPTVFPKDTTQLWIGDGDLSKDTVLIIGEGGPKRHLDFEASGRAYWEYLPNQQNYYFVVLHQSSTYNKSIFGATDFTLADAEQEVDNTSEILYRAIQYFKNRNKYVVVFGHSYSAFVIPHYLSTRPAIADKYFITGGRLTADSLQTAYQLKGINTGFEADGITLALPDENRQPNPNRRNRYFTIRKNKELLKYALGQTDYTVALKNVDLSNVVFYYGTKDENVGIPSTQEIQFLEAKNAVVKGVPTNHYKIWQRMIDDFGDGRLQLYDGVKMLD